MNETDELMALANEYADFKPAHRNYTAREKLRTAIEQVVVSRVSNALRQAEEQPPRQPLSDERIDAIPFMFNLTFGEADGQDEEEMAVALRKFAREVLAAAQEKT